VTGLLSLAIDHRVPCVAILMCQVLLGGVECSAAANTTKPAAAQTTVDVVELAARYENAEGVDRDYRRALALYCRAADQGDPNAFLGLGWMYLNGRGVAIDDAIAVRWFKKAAARGVPQAVNLLRTMPGVAPSQKTGCPLASAGSVAPPMPTPPREISTTVSRVAKDVGVDPNLVMSIIWIESEFNARAVSVKNARGLMQLMPDTAIRFHVTNPFDPTQNIRGGTAYLRWLLDRFNGDVELALGAYNAGENAVDADHGVPNYPETVRYVANVIQVYSSSSASTVVAVSQGVKKAASPK